MRQVTDFGNGEIPARQLFLVGQQLPLTLFELCYAAAINHRPGAEASEPGRFSYI